MAMPAIKFEPESPVEERVAVLEANIEYIRSDMSEMKTDIRRLNDKVDKLNDKLDSVDARLTGKVDSVEARLIGKIDALKDTFAEFKLQVEKSFADLRISRAMDRVWWLLMSAALLSVMARGFKWI